MRQLCNISYVSQVQQLESAKEFAVWERDLLMPPPGERFAAKNRQSRVTQQLLDLIPG